MLRNRRFITSNLSCQLCKVSNLKISNYQVSMTLYFRCHHSKCHNSKCRHCKCHHFKCHTFDVSLISILSSILYVFVFLSFSFLKINFHVFIFTFSFSCFHNANFWKIVFHFWKQISSLKHNFLCALIKFSFDFYLIIFTLHYVFA